MTHIRFKYVAKCMRCGHEEPEASRPRCKTCACYDAKSDYCNELAGNHYPECWVDDEATIREQPLTKAPASAEKPVEIMGGPRSVANCRLCADYNPTTDHCMRADTTKGWPDCWREREEIEAHPLLEHAHRHHSDGEWHTHPHTGEHHNEEGPVVHERTLSAADYVGSLPIEEAAKTGPQVAEPICRSCSAFEPVTGGCGSKWHCGLKRTQEERTPYEQHRVSIPLHDHLHHHSRSASFPFPSQRHNHSHAMPHHEEEG